CTRALLILPRGSLNSVRVDVNRGKSAADSTRRANALRRKRDLLGEETFSPLLSEATLPRSVLHNYTARDASSEYCGCLNGGWCQEGGVCDCAQFQALGDRCQITTPQYTVWVHNSRSVFGFSLAWDGESGVYLKMSEQHHGTPCGLCGNYNNLPNDDLTTSRGVQTEEPAVFANSWSVDLPHERGCPLVDIVFTGPCHSESDMDDAIEKCSALLFFPFLSCHDNIDPNPYVASCVSDLCVSDDEETFCRALVEYTRACNDGCEESFVHRDCISCCPPTCTFDKECLGTNLHCLDGCYCPDGLILQNGTCIAVSQCPCVYHGTSYTQGHTLEQGCSVCVCMGGVWNCTENNCTVECSVVGDVFVTSFDGRMFLQPGTCQYLRTLLGLRLQYDGRGGRVYLQLDSQWRGNTVGLCGTFNGNLRDDFLSPAGMIEGTPQLHANSWRVSSACSAPINQPIIDPCEMNQHNVFYASLCEVLMGSVFAPCHGYVSPSVYQQQCRYQACRCGNACLCTALAHYTYLCSKHHVAVNYRAHVSECGVVCMGGMLFQSCVSSCGRSCRSLSSGETCNHDDCAEGCGCSEGSYYDDIRQRCPGEVSFSAAGPCLCTNGRMECVPEEREPERGQCPEGKVFHGCSEPQGVQGVAAWRGGVACELTCRNLMLNLTCPPTTLCIPGCVCPPGLVLHRGECYYPENCPCAWLGLDVCHRGYFNCNYSPCPAVCTVYSDRHYHTFDGLEYDYHSDYGEVSIVAQNKDCYQSGIVCMKMLVIHVGFTKIYFDDNSGQPSPSSVVGKGSEFELCVTVNDMTTSSHMEVSNAQGFGDSWALGQCESDYVVKRACEGDLGRQPYAKRECALLYSDVFTPCHNVVDVSWFYRNCLTDTCNCNRGGDCECLCTSIAAYAHTCCQHGVTVVWRNPSVCPYDCEYYNQELGEGPFSVVSAIHNATVFGVNRTSGSVFPLWTRGEEFGRRASFLQHQGLFLPGHTSFELIGQPGVFLTLTRTSAQAQKYDNSDNFKTSSSFTLEESSFVIPYRMMCEWRYHACASPCVRTCSDPAATRCHFLPPVEGCFPRCPKNMVLDEVTRRCVYTEDFSPSISPSPSTTITSSTTGATTPTLTPAAVTTVTMETSSSTPPSLVVTESTTPPLLSPASHSPPPATPPQPSTQPSSSPSAPPISSPTSFSPPPPLFSSTPTPTLTTTQTHLPVTTPTETTSVFQVVYDTSVTMSTSPPETMESITTETATSPDSSYTPEAVSIPTVLSPFLLPTAPCTPPYSYRVDECAELICFNGEFLLHNSSLHCRYNTTLPRCSLLGMASVNSIRRPSPSGGTSGLCFKNLNITTPSYRIIINRLDRKVSVNHIKARLPFSRQALSVEDTGSMYLITTPGGVNIQWYHSTGIMVLQYTATSNTSAPTRGLCGCCDGNPADDLKLPNGTVVREVADLGLFLQAWRVHTSEDTEHTRRIGDNCTTGDCSTCLSMLRQRPFTPCHSKVSPEQFCDAILHYKAHQCDFLAAYNREFYEETTCSHIREECVCRSGTILHRADSTYCVTEEQCVCTDNEGSPRAPGEVWNGSLRGCCLFRCLENGSVVAVEPDCSFSPAPLCEREGEYCNLTICESEAPPCENGNRLVIGYSALSCCPEYHCECDPHACPPVTAPDCREDQFLVEVREDNSCCYSFLCVTLLGPGQSLIQFYEGELCYTVHCLTHRDTHTGYYAMDVSAVNCSQKCGPHQLYVASSDPQVCCGSCKNVSCSFNIENRTTEVFTAGSSWVDNCTRYDCVETAVGTVVLASGVVCPPFNDTECTQNGGMVQSYVDGCCRTCKEDSKMCK
ncbi:unnamed protein product, partial [Coregonus sp. 'balchen']